MTHVVAGPTYSSCQDAKIGIALSAVLISRHSFCYMKLRIAECDGENLADLEAKLVSLLHSFLGRLGACGSTLIATIPRLVNAESRPD